MDDEKNLQNPSEDKNREFYYEVQEETDGLVNLAADPRALTEDYSEDSLEDLEQATQGQDDFDTTNKKEYNEEDIKVWKRLENVLECILVILHYVVFITLYMRSWRILSMRLLQVVVTPLR